MTEKPSLRYTITKATIRPEMAGLWEGPAWRHVSHLDVDNFRQEGSDYRPATQCKLQYGAEGLYGLFKVEDRHVRCVHSEFQSEVYKDSCVEIFLEPIAGQGYFNFEFNCGGTLLAYFIKNPVRVKGILSDYTKLSPKDDKKILRYHSLPELIEPEEVISQTWFLEFHIPLAILEAYLGPLSMQSEWRGNLYKCGDDTSRPHWGAWSPVDELNFHAPNNFGCFQFS